MTHEGMSGTHDLREEPLVMILHMRSIQSCRCLRRGMTQRVLTMLLFFIVGIMSRFFGEPTKGSRLSYRGDS
jgi:hypothetical protein